jgi:hypothetical protein
MSRCSIDKADWEAGFIAGKDGKPDQPPPGVDGLAWCSGYIEGRAAGRLSARLKNFAAQANEINKEVVA